MHIQRLHRPRLDDGLVDGGSTVAAASGTGPLEFNTAAPTDIPVTSAPPLVSGSNIVLSSTPTDTSSSVPAPSDTAAGDVAAAHSSGKSQLPLGTVIAVCIGAFVGLVVIIILVYAWFKRSTDKMSSAARRNAESKADQQRERARQFQQLDDQEKPRGPVPPPSPNAREQQEMDEKNFSMFKKSPSMRSAYTHKTATDDVMHHFDLPQLDFTSYHPTLAEELALEKPEKPFAAAATRQNSGVSWDGETLGDDSFLSMRSVRVESGTMSPTMVMAKMTPPATESTMHKWESAEVEVLQAGEAAAAAPQSKNPFAEMAEEQRSRSTNPFFNAQEITRSTSRAVRSRSNSRTSRGQSIVRPDSRATVTPNTNPFLEMQEAIPMSAIEMPLPEHLLSALPTKPSVASGASLQAFGNERAMASLIAALDLSKEEVEARLRVVSMQGSTFSAYSENDEADIATMRDFPLPPGATSHSP